MPKWLRRSSPLCSLATSSPHPRPTSPLPGHLFHLRSSLRPLCPPPHTSCILRQLESPSNSLTLSPASSASRHHRVTPMGQTSLPPPPIAPAVVEVTRDIVSTSSALSPRYLFVSKHLSRLAVIVCAALPPCCISSFSLHTRIDPTTTAFTTGAPCPCIVHSRFFGSRRRSAARFIMTHPPLLFPTLPHAYQKVAFCGTRRGNTAARQDDNVTLPMPSAFII